MAIDASTWDEVQPDPVSPAPKNFAGISVKEGAELIKDWFLRNYETREGGCQYIWEGPYRADEVIREAFANVASNEIIDAAIEAVEQEGLEWVPNERRLQPPESWFDQDIPDDPRSIFMESYCQSVGVIADYGSEDGSHLINRMVFTQRVSALEAYLGDTLLNCILDKTEAMTRLLAADKSLKAQKFTLADIAANPNIVVEEVTAYLRSVLYHNFQRVDFLYWKALGVRVLEGVDSDKLLKAAEYRHCVHRNGMDKEGKRLTVFTKAYVEEIAVVMLSLVDRIEREILSGPPF
jgi:hypothetical protein